MSAYTRLASQILFPLHESLKRHSTVAVKRRMELSQWYPPEQLENLQLQRLREFLRSIGRDVPYYENLFRELQFDPEEISSLEELHTLPLTDKQTIRTHSDMMMARNARGLARYNTGGSSGEPLIFYIGKERVSHDVAAKWRATRWWDVDIGDSEIVVWGSPIELESQDRVRQIRDKLLRTHLLSAFEMSRENLDAFVDTIQQRRPRMLFGYPSALSISA